MTAPLPSPAVPDLIAADGLSAMITTRTHSAMSSLVSQKEDAIKAAVDDLMDSWSPDELKRRCEMRIDRSTGIEFFCIDGDPVLQFYPIEFSQRQTKTSYFVTATQRVRKLK